VNIHGCSLDVFPDSTCSDGNHDQFITSNGEATYHGDTTANFSKVGGNCTPLHDNLHPRCINANKPCLHSNTTKTTTMAIQQTPTPTPAPFTTCYPREENPGAGVVPENANLATIAELEKECEKFGENCEHYPDMLPNDECNAADGKLFGGEPPGTLTGSSSETNCHMSNPGICDNGCPKCDDSCSYTVYEDYKCQGHIQEKIDHKGDSVLMVAAKTGSVKIHGKGCQITFYENLNKIGQSSKYSSNNPDIKDLGDCTYCVKYACDYLKDDDKTLVTTESTENCP